MFELIVIGGGLSGAIVAREFANLNKKVLIIEKRTKLGGNVRDEKINNILVHTYGPHIFHTNNKEVYEYMNQFWQLNDYKNIVRAQVNSKKIPIPFNFFGIDTFFPNNAQKIKKKLIKKYGKDSQVSILELLKQDDEEIKEVAQFVYDNIFLNYTTKMWDKKPTEIDENVIARVPIAISYNERYFSDKYEGIPKDGYKAAIDKILNHTNINTMVDTDANKVLKFLENGKAYFQNREFKGKIVYCGPLDELFKYKYGELPYRTLNIKFKKINKNKFQDYAVINYPAHKKITRITEYKWFGNSDENNKNTIISKEVPSQFKLNSKKYGERYYPMATKQAKNLYNKYVKLTLKYKNFYPLGRLATYKYLNMDQAILMALKMSQKLLGVKWKKKN